jgi:glycerol uptake facilitator-like aquaporin
VHRLGRRLVAEFLGTLLLVTIVVGSGIAASRLSPADHGLQLLENAAATALGLFVLIAVLAPISGAHLNPLVSVADAALGRRPWSDVATYIPVQIAGALLGAVLGNLMFGLPAAAISSTERLTPGHALAEIVATAGLIVIIFVLVRTGRGNRTPAAVAAWIGSAYFFTSSTSFANPAVTVGRMFTDTFAGIAPSSALGYIVAQLVGGALGWAAVVALTGRSKSGSGSETRMTP